MGNTGLKGRLVIETDGNTNKKTESIDLTEFLIEVIDFDPMFNEDDVLAKKAPNEDGQFYLTYDESDYRLWIFDRNPDLVVRVYGPDRRLLYESKEMENVKDETFVLPEDIVIHQNNVRGWLVTHATLSPDKGTPVALFDENKIKYLIDGDTMFPAITQAVREAKSSIDLMTLFLQVDDKKSADKNEGIITHFNEDFSYTNPPQNDCIQGIKYRLDEELKQKANLVDETESAKPVRIMLADIPLSASDTVKEVQAFFEETNVVTTSFNKNFALLHAKALIVDSAKAILMGSPIKQGYFNDRNHSIFDARSKGRLLHDVSVEVEGPAVAKIHETFATVWNATDAFPIQTDNLASPPKNKNDISAVQVLRTMPGGTFTLGTDSAENLPHGETGILEAYQRAIWNAEKFIYFENQYFTYPEIVKALETRMKEKKKPKLQIIFVLNFKPDLPGYPDRQIQIINKLKIVAKKNDHEIGIYTLWSRVEPDNIEIEGKKDFQIAPIYVHSKVAIVDDVWATVGSANLDGTSLNYHQNYLIAGGKIFEKVISASPFKDSTLEFIWNALWYVLGFINKGIFGYFGLFPYLGRGAAASLAIIYKLIFDRDYLVNLFSETWEMLTELDELPGIITDALTRTSEHAVPYRSRQPSRSVELNIVLYNKVDNLPTTDRITNLRQQLWQEHLGITTLPQEMLPQNASSGTDMVLTADNWVKFWNEFAQKNLDAIKAKKKTEHNLTPRILKWTPEIHASRYLRALDIDENILKARSTRFKFDSCKFETPSILSDIADQFTKLII